MSFKPSPVKLKSMSNSLLKLFSKGRFQLNFPKLYSSSANTCSNPKILENHDVDIILDKYENFLLDCDGVLWSTDHYTKFTGIAQTIEKLRLKGKSIFFVTNNSMHARYAYKQKFRDFGGFDANEEDIFAVSYVAALYLRKLMGLKQKCYVIGNKGMETELHNVNIKSIGHGPDNEQPSDHKDDLLQHTVEENVAAVLVGFDHHFCYNKLFKATSYLSNPKCHYIATNDMEMAVQLGPKHRQPVTGAIVAAVSAASNRNPIVIGKPHDHLLKCIQMENPGLSTQNSLMIGDSQATDIHFANNSGIDSALVLTGASDMNSLGKSIEKGQHKLIPNYILPKFSDLAKNL